MNFFRKLLSRVVPDQVNAQAVVPLVEYRATPDTLAEGEATNLQGDSAGSVRVAIAGGLPINPESGRVLCDVEVEIPPPPPAEGAATEAKQDTQITLLEDLATEATQLSIKGKTDLLTFNGELLKVDIGTIEVPPPEGGATEVTLSAINGKITECDTGAVTVSTIPSIDGKGTAGSPSGGVVTVQGINLGTPLAVTSTALTSIDGKITACNTGSVTISTIPSIDGKGTAGSPSGGVLSVQGVGSGTALPISSSALTSIDGKITACNTGAVTVSTIPSIDGKGTAGSPSGGVLSVQGVGSGTALPISSSVLTSIDGKITACNTGAVTVSTIPTIEGKGTAGSPTGGVVSVQGVTSGHDLPVSVSSIPSIEGKGTAGIPSGGVLSVQGVGSGSALPISSSALTSIDGKITACNTGAVTVSTIPSIDGKGTAGSPSGGVLSVQGVGSGTALPISSSALTSIDGKITACNTGAVTVSTIPSIDGKGTAGSPSGGVLSVQGVGSGTALPVSASALPLPSGAAEQTTLSGIKTILDTDGSIAQVLASQVLPASSAYVNTSDVTVTSQRRIAFIVYYTKHASATTSYGRIRLEWKWGATVDNVSEAIMDISTLTANQPFGRGPIYCMEFNLPEVNATTTSYKLALTFETPPAATACRMAIAEFGDTTNRGTAQIWAATSQVF